MSPEDRALTLTNVAVFAAQLAADPYWAEHWRSYFASVARLADSFLTDGTEAEDGAHLA